MGLGRAFLAILCPPLSVLLDRDQLKKKGGCKLSKSRYTFKYLSGLTMSHDLDASHLSL